MSLGAEVAANDPFNEVFEAVGQRALAAGPHRCCGRQRERSRRRLVCPVGHPANCPSILAVGALDAKMQLGTFSNRAFNPDRSRRLSGTNMATHHVAGIAALWAEANPKATATELWTRLTQHARRLPLLSTDVGAGLVQAPQSTT